MSLAAVFVPDYDWDFLNQHSPTFKASGENTLPSADTKDTKSKEKKERKDKKASTQGAIPKPRLSDSPPAALPEFSLGLPAKLDREHAGTPPSTRDEITSLQLVKDNHDCEIRKLEVRIQLAELKNNTPGAASSKESSNSKSLGDMKAPQKIVNQQQQQQLYLYST